MTRKWDWAAWIGVASVAALAAGVLVLAHDGRGLRGVTLATQSVARVAFVFFWLAYAGGGLARLLGPAFDGLARQRRAFGLAFAAALLVHLAFVAWLFHISYRPPVSNGVILAFGIGAAAIYALALASLKPVRGLLGDRLWRFLSAAGLEYVALLFFRDFALLPLEYRVGHPLFYTPFAIAIVAGAALRWSAPFWRRQRAAV